MSLNRPLASDWLSLEKAEFALGYIYMYIPRSVRLQWIAAVTGWRLTSNDSPQS